MSNQILKAVYQVVQQWFIAVFYFLIPITCSGCDPAGTTPAQPQGSLGDVTDGGQPASCAAGSLCCSGSF